MLRLIFRFVPVAHPGKKVTIEVTLMPTTIEGILRLARQIADKEQLVITSLDITFALFGSVENLAKWGRSASMNEPYRN